jgi:hypothetical protein
LDSVRCLLACEINLAHFEVNVISQKTKLETTTVGTKGSAYRISIRVWSWSKLYQIVRRFFVIEHCLTSLIESVHVLQNEPSVAQNVLKIAESQCGFSLPPPPPCVFF